MEVSDQQKREFIRKVDELRAKGMDQKSASRKLGRNYTLYYVYKKQLGIPTNGKKLAQPKPVRSTNRSSPKRRPSFYQKAIAQGPAPSLVSLAIPNVAPEISAPAQGFVMITDLQTAMKLLRRQGGN